MKNLKTTKDIILALKEKKEMRSKYTSKKLAESSYQTVR